MGRLPTAGDGDEVLMTRNGVVATVTLNRPRWKNAVRLRTWQKLRDLLRELDHDPEVRVVVLTGAGADFCAGVDITEDRSGRHPLSRMNEVNEVALELHELAKPTIAKVEGVAIGAGWNLALGCDFVVASTTARFNQVFVLRGLSVDFGGSWLLPRLVGLQQAKRLAMLAENIGAEEAHRLGLVTWVTEPEQLGGFVDDLAGRLAAAAPVALAETKALLNQGAATSMREALANEARTLAVNAATADMRAAFAAFREGSTANFTGAWLPDQLLANRTEGGVTPVGQEHGDRRTADA